MSTLKTAITRKTIMSWLQPVCLLYHEFRNEKKAELDDVANNSALFIGNWICKLLYGHAIQQR